MGRPASAQRARAIDRLTEVYFVVAYLFYAGAVIPSIRFARGQDFFPGASDPVGTATQAAVLLATAVFVVMSWRTTIDRVRSATPFILLVALCGASMLWSDLPDVTLRRTVVLAGSFVLVLIAVGRLGAWRTMELVGIATVIAGVSSVLVFVLWPAVGRDLDIYGATMRGVFAQKNALAGAMLPGVITTLVLWLRDGKLVHLLAIAGLFVVIILAGSISALAIAALLVAVALLFANRFSWSFRALLVYGYVATATVAVIALAFFPTELFGFFGRDISLTGRIGIWTQAARYIADAPVLGHGYAAFWNLAGPETQYIHLIQRWPVPDAHNGFIDTALQLGMLGLGVMAWAVGGIALKGVGEGGERPLWDRAWIVMTVIAFLAINLTESRLIEPGWTTVLLLIAWLALSGQPRRAAASLPIAAFGTRPPTRRVGGVLKAAGRSDADD